MLGLSPGNSSSLYEMRTFFFEQNYKIDPICVSSSTACDFFSISSLYGILPHEQVRRISSQNLKVFLTPASKVEATAIR